MTCCIEFNIISKKDSLQVKSKLYLKLHFKFNVTKHHNGEKKSRPNKMTERKRKKTHSVSRLESVQNSVFDVLNCHGQKLAHLPKMQCQTNLHFLQIKTDVYLVPFPYMH